jgi:Fe-Mn family superoxide dismutase
MKFYRSVCYNDQDLNHRYLKKFAYSVFNNYIINKGNKIPTIIRIDISYGIDNIFLDSEYVFKDTRYNSKNTFVEEKERPSRCHDGEAVDKNNDFYIGFYFFRREKDGSIIRRDYYTEDENGEKVVKVMETVSTPEIVELEFNETPISYCDTTFRMGSLEQIYNYKKATRRTQDINDIFVLEPYIDKETMYYHHDLHHQGYVDNLNNALEKYPEFHNYTLVELLQNLDSLPKDIQTKVRNNAGGVFNHNLFFKIMKPNALKHPYGNISNALNNRFGSFDNFKDTFKKAAIDRFGSGWAWLVKDKNNDLMIITTPNQDVPLQLEVSPIIPLDVWEHAYYLKYQNRRKDYIDNWFNVIDWNRAEDIFNEVRH